MPRGGTKFLCEARKFPGASNPATKGIMRESSNTSPTDRPQNYFGALNYWTWMSDVTVMRGHSDKFDGLASQSTLDLSSIVTGFLTWDPVFASPSRHQTVATSTQRVFDTWCDAYNDFSRHEQLDVEDSFNITTTGCIDVGVILPFIALRAACSFRLDCKAAALEFAGTTLFLLLGLSGVQAATDERGAHCLGFAVLGRTVPRLSAGSCFLQCAEMIHYQDLDPGQSSTQEKINSPDLLAVAPSDNENALPNRDVVGRSAGSAGTCKP
ncbi:hypothetical protein BDR05DRAFT_952596 [Suillus weaverae]|nr:hypothetical protein BDR05DRAFT_952596 [Suillus weaverae]